MIRNCKRQKRDREQKRQRETKEKRKEEMTKFAERQM
jgi:hypothetical protein